MNAWSFWKIKSLCILLCHLASCEFLQSNDVEQPDLDCAFEDGMSMCMWQDTSESFRLRWKIYRDIDPHTQSTGPGEDHTTGHGQYLAMRTGQAYEAGNATLSSPQIDTSRNTCLSFWYFMHGLHVGSLNVYKIRQGYDKMGLFSMSGPQGPRWYRADVNTGKGIFTLEIEATYSQAADYSDIAIDDITFSYQPCKENESGIAKDQPHFDCDFEYNLCGWYTIMERNTMEWRRVFQRTHRRDALPPRSNGTHYAALLRSRSGYSSKLELRSPALSVDSNGACMTFWFKMEGAMASGFLVNVIDYWKDYHSSTNTIFSTLPKTHGWTQAFITLPKAKQLIVGLQGESKGSSYGKIAVDDVRVTQGGPCPEVNQEDLINCDFERDFCRWYMTSNTAEGDWIRTKDPTPTNATGPSHDHSGDGYYIFLDGATVEAARLYSPLINASDGGACLSFWCYMYGEDVFRLELAFKRYGVEDEVLWSLEGSQEDRWVQQNVSLASHSDGYLLFTARRGYFPKSDIALDDISISFGLPCEREKVSTTSAPSIIIPEETTTVAATRRTSPPTTEPSPIETPRLIAMGEIDPAYVKSRVELVCQQPDQSLVTRWFKRRKMYLGQFHEMFNHHGERSLVFNEIQMSDTGTFWCAVSRYLDPISAAHMSNELEINVVPDSRASPHLEVEGEGAHLHGANDVDVEASAVVTMTCGRPVEDGQYHWKTTSPAFSSSTLPDRRILVLNETKTDHTGVYSCRITKDGLATSVSNELNVVVKKGRRCKYYYECTGYGYDQSCGYDNRCRCGENAVADGRACKVRPTKPTIVTSPGYQEFGIGESFYLICIPEAPVFNNLTFTFRNDDQPAVESVRVLKINNATEEDSGSYVCSVTYDHVTSYDSDAIDIQIRDFTNLNCDFAKDLCAWSQGQEVDAAEFVITSSNDGDVSTIVRSGPFIQLDASNTKVPNRATLVSPTIERMALDSCLTFWYRMHGPDVYSLSVWKFSSQRFSSYEFKYVGTEIWTVVGEKGTDWIRENVTVEKGNDFYITFEAIGQAAIDDVIFTYRGGC